MVFFVGIDWANTEHAACLIDQAGKTLEHFSFEHSAEGIAGCLKRLVRYAPASELMVAIERPSGLLVDVLVEAGLVVVPIHPNVVKATRPRYSAALAKSDLGDAYLLADVLRTDGHRFNRLHPHSDETRALRALVRTRDDLVTERVRLINQLSALLDSFWPGPLKLFYSLEAKVALAFLRRFPTPQSAEKLTEKQLATFLKKHAYSGGRTAAELLARLKRAPVRKVGAHEATASGTLVVSLVTLLETLIAQLASVEKAVSQALAAHPDGKLLASFPRAGQVNAAQILAELGDDRGRFTSAEHLAGEAGVAPVTEQSGFVTRKGVKTENKRVRARKACNKRLRRALTCLADNSRHSSPWAHDIYNRARARGCTHQAATRILARAWCKVIWRCWQDRENYAEHRHQAALRLKVAA